MMRWVMTTSSGTDISRKCERKTKRQEAVMMTVKDDRRGSVRLLLPPVASEKPSDVNDTERA